MTMGRICLSFCNPSQGKQLKQPRPSQLPGSAAHNHVLNAAKKPLALIALASIVLHLKKVIRCLFRVHVRQSHTVHPDNRIERFAEDIAADKVKLNLLAHTDGRAGIHVKAGELSCGYGKCR